MALLRRIRPTVSMLALFRLRNTVLAGGSDEPPGQVEVGVDRVPGAQPGGEVGVGRALPPQYRRESLLLQHLLPRHQGQGTGGRPEGLGELRLRGQQSFYM